MKRSSKDVLLAMCLLCMAALSTAKEVDADLQKLVEELEDRVAKLEVEEMKKEMAEVKDELEDRVAKLEELAQVGTLRTCAEYGKYGLQRSGAYMVDPDGGLIGEEPFQVYCNFTSGATEVYHDTELSTEVEHCHDPGCYNKTITYINGANGDQRPIPLSQIVSLIELSEFCHQEIRYDCTLAPLNTEDIDYAYWEDRNGETNVYFTGSNYGYHVCDCNYEDPQCIDEETKGNTCNCDANLPIPSFDTGTITNMTALPVKKLFFGGLNYALQFAAFTLGRLKCYGEREIEVATSCSALKTAGVLKSGYYHVKGPGDLRPSLAFCNMESGTYADVAQLDQPSEDSPIGTILAWVSKPEENLTVLSSLPEGWLFCNGSTIPQGPWVGGRTPDLNGGHFLRGGTEEEMLMFEEDQLMDHQHIDGGHAHSASSTSTPHSHSYTDRYFDPQGVTSTSYTSGTYPHGDAKSSTETSGSKTVSVSTTVSSHTSGLGGVSSSYSAGAETRPINMRVVWVIRCW